MKRALRWNKKHFSSYLKGTFTEASKTIFFEKWGSNFKLFFYLVNIFLNNEILIFVFTKSVKHEKRMLLKCYLKDTPREQAPSAFAKTPALAKSTNMGT